jgi:hypothetical protein
VWFHAGRVERPSHLFAVNALVPSSRPGSEYGRSTLSEFARLRACSSLSISNKVGLRIGSTLGCFAIAEVYRGTFGELKLPIEDGSPSGILIDVNSTLPLSKTS